MSTDGPGTCSQNFGRDELVTGFGTRSVLVVVVLTDPRGSKCSYMIYFGLKVLSI